MFACPEGWSIVVSRLTPLALVNLAVVAALNFGLKASLSHWPNWNGLESGTETVAGPSGVTNPVTADSVARGPQLVGLNRKFGLLTTTLRLRRRMGTPRTIVGSTVVATTRALFW